MSWQVLRPQVKELVETLASIHEVSGTAKIKFQGYPAAHVVKSDNSNDYETNKENTRVYAFIVRVFYETKSPQGSAVDGVAYAEEALEPILDQLIDLFDEEDQKGDDTRILGVDLPANKMFLYITATPGRWGHLPEDALVFAEVTVRVCISADVS